MGDTGLHPLPDEVSFKLSEDRQEACHSPSARRRKVECLREAYESHPQLPQLIEGVNPTFVSPGIK